MDSTMLVLLMYYYHILELVMKEGGSDDLLSAFSFFTFYKNVAHCRLSKRSYLSLFIIKLSI